MFLACFETYELDFLIEKMFYTYSSFKNITKINLHKTYFVKTQYFVIANLVHTNKKSRFAEILP